MDLPDAASCADRALTTLAYLVAEGRLRAATDTVRLLDQLPLLPDQERMLEMLRDLLLWQWRERLSRLRASKVKPQPASRCRLLSFPASRSAIAFSASASSADESFDSATG
jgi:hypothetical protein